MRTQTPACCIAYTTDSTYLFPTFVSAVQARQFSSPGKADVVIFCFDMTAEAEAAFAPACDREGVRLIPVSSALLEGESIMLARLFLNDFAPAEYSQYLYIDGDTQIGGSLDPLIDAEVPAGHFMAANDPMTFLLADNGPMSKDLNAHLASIGLTPEQGFSYFNSGVLRINRDGWESMGADSWNHFRQHGKPRFPDQDSLNVVAGSRRLPMSLAWNFPIFMRNSRVEGRIQPRITHFMSSPKPWHGSFAPWTSAAVEPYKAALSRYPELTKFNMTMSLRSRAFYQLQQRRKQVLETLTWGFSQRRERILSYQSSCAV
ncbi:glycosyl transferase family 8 [Granulicella sp. WH15]|uniref:glycosyltransferase family 8 protein n=1 Tax=Granulicella sp. WH15 TaxID=2602070 RepID=UPI00136703B7|nr:glycosyltransferase [Granulicella sp. WH15]QHN02177.1 glycosyl transferase family 8 [Granulicella sp. WH15]